MSTAHINIMKLFRQVGGSKSFWVGGNISVSHVDGKRGGSVCQEGM